MSDQQYPAPLVPAEVDLRDFGFAGLARVQLRDGATVTRDGFRVWEPTA